MQPGDTLSSIAAKFGLTTGLIQTLNPQIATPDLLYVGQRLALPDNAVPLAETVRLTHTVRPGETLGGLAALYGTSLAALRALNPGLNPDLLFVGSELVVRDDFAPRPQRRPSRPSRPRRRPPRDWPARTSPPTSSSPAIPTTHSPSASAPASLASSLSTPPFPPTACAPAP